jgi:hypothetical protein
LFISLLQVVGHCQVADVQTTENARSPCGAGRFFSVRGSGRARVGQFVDELIQFIFNDAHAPFAKANEAQATFVYQLVKAGMPNTESPRCFLRTKDAPRHGDLRQMAAMECGLRRRSYSMSRDVGMRDKREGRLDLIS